MYRKSPNSPLLLASRLLAGSALVAMLIAPAIAKQELPEVSEDGLHLLKDTKARVVYAKPGVTRQVSGDSPQGFSVLHRPVLHSGRRPWRRRLGCNGRPGRALARLRGRLAGLRGPWPPPPAR